MPPKTATTSTTTPATATASGKEVDDVNEYDADYARIPSRMRRPSPIAGRSEGETAAGDAVEGDTETTTIAICGGGLAGLAVAVGLQRRGIGPVRVYERAPRLRNDSQGMLSLQPNGLRALAKLHPDLPGMAEAAGCELQRSIMRTIVSSDGHDGRDEEEGDQIRNLDWKEMSLKKYGMVPILIQWHALQKVLASCLIDKNKNNNNNNNNNNKKDRGNSIIATGKSLHSFREFDDCVRLYFEDGSVVKCLALVACDGTFSRARQQILSSAAPDDIDDHGGGDDDDDSAMPVFFGQVNWNAIVPSTSVPEAFRPPTSTVVVTTYKGGGGGNISQHQHDEKKNGDDVETQWRQQQPPIPRWSAMFNDCDGGNHCFWQLRLVDPDKAMALSGNDGRGGLGLAGVKEALRPLLRPSAAIAAALESTPEPRIFERSIVGHRRPARTWRSPRGRAALVGDAAHAMHPHVGQGGNSAFESAAIVVESLCQCQGDWVAGLARYEAVRKPRADWVQRYSNMAGCSQRSGKSFLGRSVAGRINDWILRGSAAEDLLPDDVASKQTLLDFDPCDQDGVAPIDDL